MDKYSGFSSLVLFAFLFLNSVFCDEINFYDENGSFSMIRTMGYGGCYKFAPVWDRRATAIDIVEERTCFNVWKNPDCTGESLKLTKKEGSYELKNLNFDKAIRSVSLCSWDEQGRPDPMRGFQTYNNRPVVQPIRSEVGSDYHGGIRGESSPIMTNTEYRNRVHQDNYGRVQQNDNLFQVVPAGDRPSPIRGDTYDSQYYTPIRGPINRPSDRPISSTTQTTPNSGSQQSNEDVWDLAVQEHNKFRKEKGATELKGNPKIHQDAQTYAESLAASNKLEATTFGNRYASNIATSFRRSKADSVKDAISRWFNKAKLNDYELEATEMGIGAAWNERERHWVIVAFYHLPDLYYIQKFHDQTGGNIPSGRPLRIP